MISLNSILFHSCKFNLVEEKFKPPSCGAVGLKPRAASTKVALKLSQRLPPRPEEWRLEVTPRSTSLRLFPTNTLYGMSSNKTASTILRHISTCNHKSQALQSVLTGSKTPTPVGSPSRTAPLRPTHPFSTLSNPPKSTAALPAPHALLEEPISSSTTQQTRRDATDSGHARGASRMTRPSSERPRRLS